MNKILSILLKRKVSGKVRSNKASVSKFITRFIYSCRIFNYNHYQIVFTAY